MPESKMKERCFNLLIFIVIIICLMDIVFSTQSLFVAHVDFYGCLHCECQFHLYAFALSTDNVWSFIPCNFIVIKHMNNCTKDSWPYLIELHDYHPNCKVNNQNYWWKLLKICSITTGSPVTQVVISFKWKCKI